MRKEDIITIFSIILILGVLFCNQGLNGVFDFFKIVGIIMWGMLKLLNIVTIEIIGDGVLTLIFKTTITFTIVGLILEVLSIPKGTFGKWFGKVAFWLVGLPISFILNILGKLIFK